MSGSDTLPAYLRFPSPGPLEPMGTLRWDGGHWLIEGDPQAVLMAKRLFPGARGRGSGVARFPDGRRLFGDLVWFLQRYPLEIADADRFEACHKAACDHAHERLAARTGPTPRPMPPATFTGEMKTFQSEGVGWLLREKRTLLADEMGLGKTVQALAGMATAQAWPALVVPPPHLVDHWLEKAQQFLDSAPARGGLFDTAAQDAALKIHRIEGLKPGDLPEAHIYVCHYLLLDAWKAVLRDIGLRLAAFDEIQELRNQKSMKYGAAAVISQPIEYVWGLSGTPIYNRGAEIWNVLNIVDYHCLGDYDGFTWEWCGRSGGEVVSDPAMLGRHLEREGLMLRRRKEDVLADLPEKRRVVQSVDSDDGVFGDLLAEAQQMARDAAELKDPFERGRLEGQALATLRRATGLGKVPAVIGFLRALMAAGEPTLCFAYHHQVFEALMMGLEEFKPVKITGKEGHAEKTASKAAFIRGDTDLCLMSLRAAAGLDGLQERARIVVFGELDWSPAVHSQGEDRAHRMGVRDSVLAYYLTTEDGTDPHMQDVLGLKVAQFQGLMGDAPESEQDKALAAERTSSHKKALLAMLRGEGGDG